MNNSLVMLPGCVSLSIQLNFMEASGDGDHLVVRFIVHTLRTVPTFWSQTYLPGMAKPFFSGGSPMKKDTLGSLPKQKIENTFKFFQNKPFPMHSSPNLIIMIYFYAFLVTLGHRFTSVGIFWLYFYVKIGSLCRFLYLLGLCFRFPFRVLFSCVNVIYLIWCYSYENI